MSGFGGFAIRAEAERFNPLKLPQLAAWLDWNNATDTGTLILPDRKGGSPAVQSTQIIKPARSMSPNGVGFGTFSSSLLTLPLSPAINDNVKFGMGFWAKMGNISGTKTICAISNAAGGANADKLLVLAIGSVLQIRATSVDRRAQINPLDLNWKFFYVGADGSKGTEATRALMGFQGALDPNVFFSSDTTWPATLGTPTGNMFIGASTAAAGSPFVGSIADIYFFNDQLSQADLRNIMNYKRPLLSGFAGNVLCLGNSITAGSGLGALQDYPAVLLSSLGGATWQVYNSGRPGQNTLQLLTNYVNYVEGYFTGYSPRNIMVVNEVGNDLINGATESTARANMQALIARGRAQGWTVYFATTTPRTVPNFTAPQQTAANNINAYFRNNPSEYDGLIDWAADPRLSDPSNTTFYQDGLHPTAAGAGVLAELALDAIS